MSEKLSRKRYVIAVKIGKNLPMSNETLKYIKEHDPELYKVIMPEADE